MVQKRYSIKLITDLLTIFLCKFCKFFAFCKKRTHILQNPYPLQPQAINKKETRNLKEKLFLFSNETVFFLVKK